MCNAVDDGLRFNGERKVAATLFLWPFLLCLWLAFPVAGHADDSRQGDAKDRGDLTALPLSNLSATLMPDVNKLLGANITPAPAPDGSTILAAKSSVRVPSTSAVSPLVDAYSPSCPNNGASDASACLQAAVESHMNILLVHGIYLVTHAIHVPTGRNIQCAGNLTAIYNPRTSGPEADTFIFDSVSSGSLSNCLLQGSNDTLHPTYSRASEFILPVLIRNSSSNVIIDHNRFQGCPGDACVLVYGDPGTPPNRNITISNNTCLGSGLYCIALVSSLGSKVINNRATDASIGSEADVPVGQVNAYNLFEGNVVKRVNGAGDKALNNNVFITGGAAAGADYSTNIVRKNTLLGGAVLDKRGTRPALYQ
jgi:parallel beta-helix repeat protein